MCSRKAIVRVPVDRRIEPGIDVGERIGHHMGGGKRHAVQRAVQPGRKHPRRREPVGFETAIRASGSFSDSDDSGRTGLFMT